jgi:three-Cys-motif partner protein
MQNENQNWGGTWTEQKLVAFEKYVNAYLTIMLNQRIKYNGWPQKIIYIDGFAGCGDRSSHKNKDTDDTLLFSELDIDESEINVYKGSAERVVRLDKKFDEYYFIDADENALNKLKTKIEPYFDKKLKYEFLPKDINEVLSSFSNDLDNSKVALILLDPFGMQLNWASIENLKNKRVDIWILLPSGIIINRLLDRKGTFSFLHCKYMLFTHSGFINLALLPDSPPTITQSIFSRSILSMGPIKGSNETNFIVAFIFLKISILYM